MWAQWKKATCSVVVASCRMCPTWSRQCSCGPSSFFLVVQYSCRICVCGFAAGGFHCDWWPYQLQPRPARPDHGPSNRSLQQQFVPPASRPASVVRKPLSVMFLPIMHAGMVFTAARHISEMENNIFISCTVGTASAVVHLKPSNDHQTRNSIESPLLLLLLLVCWSHFHWSAFLCGERRGWWRRQSALCDVNDRDFVRLLLWWTHEWRWST